MQQFDCLAKELPLFGPHFLEASAGTGKTFAIEHIVARLIQSGVDLEQILVVTFTKAATRELKQRIRSSLEKYQLVDALAGFDRSQIFTIHGFCSRMLKEYAFDANILLGFREAKSAPVERALFDFFEKGLSKDQVSPAQLGILLRWAGSVEGLARKLKKEEKPLSAKSFAQRCREFQYDVPEKLSFDRSSYKKMDGDFEGQIDALIARDLERLISEENSIFEFTAPENRKVKATQFFDWGRETVWPMIQEAKDPKQILNAVLAVWKPIEEQTLLEAGVMGPDQLLKTMAEAIKIDAFRKKVQSKYRAVVIDEFQDTDPWQWEIFETLFLNAEALYLIGDPKQSIYRFRKADLYTYLKAKEAIPPEGHYYLDTNYRSSKPLIDALNALFDRQWLHLPKQKKILPYLPVRAGLDLSSDLYDGKGAVHCVHIDKENIYTYVAREVMALEKPFNSIAVLVKDRHAASEMQRIFAEHNIPAALRSQEPVSADLAFVAFVELFDALHSPTDLNKAKIALAGPFGGLTGEEIAALDASPFGPLRNILDEKGIAALFRELPSLPPNFSQILEILFEWERNNGFSFPGVFRFFESIEQMDPEDAPKLRKEVEEDAVQIMTMHVSKGLEFDIVFALGVSSRTPEGDEEAEAEKLRQLYVALTRAKRRLYIPILLETKEAKTGTASPIELFCQNLTSDELNRISQKTSLTIERIEAPIVTMPLPKTAPPQPTAPLPIPTYQSSYLLSFTAISQDSAVQPLEPIPDPQGIYTPQNLPRGAETGVIVHKIFERAFSEPCLATIVEEEMGPLAPWKEVLISLVEKSLQLPLSVGFSLNDIDRKNVRIETEFLFPDGANYLKGFIDLLFVHEHKLYFVDWKTNWLPEYTPQNLQEAISSHQYDLQASIYTEALKRQWDGEIGGAIYLFVRGPAAICFNSRKYGH